MPETPPDDQPEVEFNPDQDLGDAVPIDALEPADFPTPVLSEPRRATLSSLKVPPHSVEAEQSVLGGLMLSGEAWFSVADKVAAEDFYRVNHQIIFEAMFALAEENAPLDAVTLAERLETKGQLEKAGGYAYLGELTEMTPGASNVVAYANIVKERATLRRLISAANTIVERAFAPDGLDSSGLLNLAEQEIFQISEGNLQDSGPQKVGPLLKQTVSRVQELFGSSSRITGVPTGFEDLDAKTAGLQPSDLIIVAGRPSMGKTSLGMNMIEHAVMAEQGPVLVFSMEMSADQLVMRMLSSLGRIDQTRLRTGDLKEEDWDRFTSAVSQLKDKQLLIDDTPALSPNDLRTRTRRVAREYGPLRAIMVDYLQLMRGSGKSDNRTGEISEISRSLKALAKEMRCPVIALSQLNRALENRTDRRPVMADLRECVTADTLVTLADGRRVSIAELVGTEPEVLAMTAQQTVEPARSDRVWPVGKRAVLQLRLASGRTLKATAKHRLYTATGWQTLAELNTGDRVALARRLPEPLQCVHWPEQQLRLSAASISARNLDLRCRNARVPEPIFRLDNAQIALFVKHLWTAAASDQGRRAAPVNFTACSEALARDVAALLLRLGIVASLRGIQEQHSPLFRVDVSARKDQQRLLDQVLGLSGQCEPAQEQVLGLAMGNSASKVGAQPAELSQHKGQQHWPASALFWDRVVSIEPAAEEMVYDLTVPGPASWLADGIVSHNSGAIEQDADVIIFIYRDEVYNEESADKGTAEIIISKQRNGPTGTVRLSFIGNLTKFENLAADRYNDYMH